MSKLATAAPDEPEPGCPLLLGMLATTGRPVYAIVDTTRPNPTPSRGTPGPGRVDRALLDRMIDRRRRRGSGPRRP
ncbi:hypothetical protein [Embleya hyalina]|uniref:Uncharacterized protein n=1 Tax=Embleya hyalina TaxID=516124 RepID=A0A401YYM7_9ACTN|nr:hypothetical protein [Embleya hyalina]GCD99729.1 hypothetical protein EHYA_07451 [Embleya hyalina]